MCLLPISSCEDFVPFDRVYSFWVENKSDESISFLVSYNYPDTIIPDNYNELKGVMPGSKSPYDSDEKWEDVFKSLPSDTLSIFIFRAKTISYYDWQLIRNNYKILKRYDISLGDLKQKKWIIPYP
jgi:hypothetical protein